MSKAAEPAALVATAVPCRVPRAFAGGFSHTSSANGELEETPAFAIASAAMVRCPMLVWLEGIAISNWLNLFNRFDLGSTRRLSQGADNMKAIDTKASALVK